MTSERRIILQHADQPGYTADFACYLHHGGYEDLKKALKMRPQEIKEEVCKSQLRGRGGAGFLCGAKWNFIDSSKTQRPVYLICNADESEPGTFKDRQIIDKDPHQLLEGMIIACYANSVRLAYIYIRGEFFQGAKILEQALQEARRAGFWGENILGSGYSLDIHVHRGAGAYICGEETGLIESLEGKRPYPRIKPPYFPASIGLYGSPTIVNNVETLCNIKHILQMGGDEFAKIGRPNNTGTRILCVSGDVQKPGYFEFECGKITFGELIYDVCGGIRNNNRLKAVIPGGISAKILRADRMFKIRQPDRSVQEMNLANLPIDFDTLAEAGSMAGSGGIIVLDHTRDMAKCLANITAFYAHESCGQCTPCREGTLWMKKILRRIETGNARSEDAELLKEIADGIAGRTVCAFGEACAWPVQSFLENFKGEFMPHGGVIV
ncbi:MAG: NADH-quinone oxidoreductase subunit NuoF [Verrucomicrobiota bacterium]